MTTIQVCCYKVERWSCQVLHIGPVETSNLGTMVDLGLHWVVNQAGWGPFPECFDIFWINVAGVEKCLIWFDCRWCRRCCCQVERDREEMRQQGMRPKMLGDLETDNTREQYMIIQDNTHLDSLIVLDSFSFRLATTMFASILWLTLLHCLRLAAALSCSLRLPSETREACIRRDTAMFCRKGGPCRGLSVCWSMLRLIIHIYSLYRLRWKLLEHRQQLSLNKSHQNDCTSIVKYVALTANLPLAWDMRSVIL
jgi:hypothetical protein